MNAHETKAVYNLAETCSDSMSLEDLEALGGQPIFGPNAKMSKQKLTYGHIRGSPELRQNIARLYSPPEGALSEENVLIQNGAIGYVCSKHYYYYYSLSLSLSLFLDSHKM